MDIPEIRCTLDEIKALYFLEPSLKDIYVEGSDDAHILKWFFKQKNRRDVHVYSVDLIEIPDAVLERANLCPHSARNKVLLLAQELGSHFNDPQLKVKCVVDADYDRYLDRCRESYVLEYTDYTSMEMYLFNESLIDKFLTLALRGFRFSASALMHQLSGIVERLFLVRLTNERLGWRMTWPCSTRFGGRYLSWSPDGVHFDEECFITNYLMSNARRGDMGEFKAVMDELAGIFDPDPRHNMRGHDFTLVFFLVVRKFKSHRAEFKDVATFEGALSGCLELAFVESEPLFVKLVQ
jgi:hypothetical protein